MQLFGSSPSENPGQETLFQPFLKTGVIVRVTVGVGVTVGGKVGAPIVKNKNRVIPKEKTSLRRSLGKNKCISQLRSIYWVMSTFSHQKTQVVNLGL